MTPRASNILTFPSSSPVPSVLVRPVERIIQPENLNRLSADERADYVSSIIRAAIGFAKRKGRRLESLPPQLRVWLLDLCELGDPTCLAVRDWLGGNSRFMAASVEEGA